MGVSVKSHSEREVIIKVSAGLGWVLGGLFALAGLIPVYLMGDHQLECSRMPNGGECVVSHKGVFADDPMRFPAAALQGASLDTHHNSRDGGMTYRVVLETVDHHYPLTSSYSSGTSKKRAFIAAVNQFANDPTISELRVAESERLMGFFFASIFVVSGLSVLLLSRYGTIRLSVDDDKVQFRLRNLLGMKKELEVPLDEIAEARVERTRSSDSKSYSYRVTLFKKDGGKVPLTVSYSSGSHGSNQFVVDTIDELLKTAEKRREWFAAPSTR